MDSIRATFEEYDANGDGTISKLEMEELVRNRTQERINFIEDRFQDLLDDPEVSDEDIARAEEMKKQHLQHLEESKTRMIKMFDAADINGDGMLSVPEFMLMEAWWMRCTLNPMRAHLF
jgi:Ca2+-binding EF-hand superfamily protein